MYSMYVPYYSSISLHLVEPGDRIHQRGEKYSSRLTIKIYLKWQLNDYAQVHLSKRNSVRNY